MAIDYGWNELACNGKNKKSVKKRLKTKIPQKKPKKKHQKQQTLPGPTKTPQNRR